MIGKTVTTVLLALVGSLCMVWSLFAQAPQLGEVDKEFVREAPSSGQSEIQLGKIASTRASREGVRDFASRLERDHTAANTALLTILSKEGISVERVMEPYLATAKHLDGLEGEAFDRAYLQHIIQEHEKAIALYTRQAQEGQHPDLRDFASNTLPTLQEHLQQARNLAAERP